MDVIMSEPKSTAKVVAEFVVGFVTMVIAVPVMIVIIILAFVLCYRVLHFIAPPILCGIVNVADCREPWLNDKSGWWDGNP